MLNDNRIAQQWTQLQLTELAGSQVTAQLLLQVIQSANIPAAVPFSVQEATLSNIHIHTQLETATSTWLLQKLLQILIFGHSARPHYAV